MSEERGKESRLDVRAWLRRLRAVSTSPRARKALWLASPLLLLLVLHLWITLTTRPDQLLTQTEVVPRGESRELAVLLHAYARGPESLEDVRRVVETARPNADLLMPRWDSRLFSNADPRDIANQLRRRLDALHARRGYERILLVGHSVGALLVRQAYLDRRTQALEAGEPDSWAHRVDRLVLLAGMNRGWSVDPKPRNMTHLRRWAIQGAQWVARLSGTGGLVRSVERGSPFVNNLRIRWLRAAREPDLRLPPTFQMLGLTDDVVSREDHLDLGASAAFTFVEVSGTHASLIRLDETPAGRERAAVLADLVSDRSPADLRRRHGRLDLAVSREQRRRDEDHIVFIVHGIRDDAEWIGRLEREIARLGWQRWEAGETTERVRVVTSEYGYFPMGSFLISPWRNEKVRWFVDLYTEELARSVSPDTRVSVVGHSNGTFVLAQALRDYEAVDFRHVAFAGSVVPQAFPWDDLLARGRVRAVRNDRAAGDWVVAIFPRLFELGARLSGQRDGWLAEIGAGGFRGFLDAGGKARETILVGGHGAALVDDNFETLARFLLTGEGAPPSALVVRDVSAPVSLLSRLCWLVWAMLLVAVFLLGRLAVRWLDRWIPRWLGWSGYAVFILLILQTI